MAGLGHVAHVMHGAGQCVLGNPPTLAFTRDVCRALLREQVPGDLVECGVASGSHPAVMAAVLDELEPASGRLVHLFDSFVGIPHAGPHDDETIVGCIGGPADGELVSSGVSAFSAVRVRSNMAQWGQHWRRCVFHEGWLQDTIPAAWPTMRPIAYLRIDVDLYESTRVALRLCEFVSPGGVIVVDDYRLTGCRRAVDEYLAERGWTPAIREIGGGEGPVWWAR